MVFSTPVFLYIFLSLVVLAYALFPRKSLVFIIASLIFYAYGKSLLILLLVAVTRANYVLGRPIDRNSPYRFCYLFSWSSEVALTRPLCIGRVTGVQYDQIFTEYLKVIK